MSAKKQAATSAQTIPRHRASAIPESLTHIPNYPNKLVIYQNAASRYWWVITAEQKRVNREYDEAVKDRAKWAAIRKRRKSKAS